MIFQKFIKLICCIREMLLVSIVVLTAFVITACSKPVKPNEVYCLVSKDGAFYQNLRVEVRTIANEFGFSYYDTSPQVWADMSSGRSSYDPKRFVDLLVKDNDSYVLMLNSIGEPYGRVSVSIFSRHDRNIEDFSKKVKHALLRYAPGQNSTSPKNCLS